MCLQTKTDRPNYLESIPRDWNWYETYKSARGVDALHTFVDRVYKFLMNMKPDSFFRIDSGVKPENADLFIKVCCMFISEYGYLPDRTDYYEFNADATFIRRHSIPVSEPKKPKAKTVQST
jgi:hypothetical protein